ncbi:MAG: hypothetical protein CMQ20_13430 [Gammaproteobacteria bacterium]|jgi:uncharacterized tellurite resistance protein B-like protein|nr:hypothetical protein [Gammaproteobacteria bacterium]|tara:strand:+ start:204 stop:656 length:453 start_codon:yes stop_codon:yes gene_type:complete
MTKDFKTFFDIYVRPSPGTRIDRDSYEFKYAAAALLVACSKADFDEDPEEEKAIIEILQDTLKVAATTLESLLQMADAASEEENLADITDLVNEYVCEADKHFLVENLWRVAYADGRLDKYEQLFIERIASLIQLTADDVDRAHQVWKPS